MLEWLDRYMAKFAQTDHIRREEHARRQEEASPAHEEAVALLEAFPYSGPGRARVIAAALSAISQETLLDAAYACFYPTRCCLRELSCSKALCAITFCASLDRTNLSCQ